MESLQYMDTAGVASFVAGIPADTKDPVKAKARQEAWEELVRRLGENFATSAVERRLKHAKRQ